MLIILPPSETKAFGGDGDPLDLASLSFPSLHDNRQNIIDILRQYDVDEAMKVLKISEALRAEAEENSKLLTGPTMPALYRYTGVLYDALDAKTLSDKAWDQLAIGSALFGVVRPRDMIPFYRLSGGTKLYDATMKSRWGNSITKALEAEDDFIIDLRSGTYQALGRVKSAVTVRVENSEGKVISHFNKFHKGQLARAIAGKDLHSIEDIMDTPGFRFTEVNGTQLTMVV
ncbi:YaaA family protein [Corynebacterium ammoniagenes]|uniref:Uncharacterized protein n=1 Tax=Corynebacterium ammoniagenes DSM 20306 TaxID=649754 RepID=A0ABN0AIK7_CORAM|nr:peroxide stress protein YaaA [Corynebacterium ammoniagenes]APT82430.1 hypothetical protein CAMM_05685 [Corynebacterium ammoniagenes DSM 20306]AQS73514.1 peroxide stress protein YaaA [Corynebacterium ammoniagenes]EFG82641.1 hypothetical protein HMPREF0281_00171 [Corynebacterium ammoniagenes DSM 20306]